MRFRYFLLIFTTIILLLSPLAIHAQDKDVSYIIITSNETEELTKEWEKSIETVISNSQPRRLDYHSPEADEIIKRLGLKFIPYLIFDKGIGESEKFFDLVRQGMIERKMGEYVIPEAILLQSSVMLLGRDPNPGQLDVFTMSYDPAGRESLRQIGNHIEKNPGAFNVVCRYLATFREFGIDSQRGPDEINEDIRQLLIQKYYPDKFWQYLRKLNEGKNFEAAFNELGIDAPLMLSRKQEGIELLEKDFNLAASLSISMSPTFLWENRFLCRTFDKLRQLVQPFNPVSPQAAQASPDAKAFPDAIPITVFHTPNCPNCRNVMDEFLPKLKEEFGDAIALEYYDTSIQENFEKRLKMEEEYGVLGGGVIPEVVVLGIVLVGEIEIKDKLRDILKKNSAKKPLTPPK